MSVVTGGSAGGYGALLLYGAFRQILPSGEKMITISDSGTPYFTGTPSPSGKTWASQGYLGFPTSRTGCSECVSPSTVSYQEAYMADAWGLTWMTDYNPSFVSQETPAGSPGPLVSMQGVLAAEVFHDTSSSDNFYVIDGNDDYVDTWFWSMNFDTSSSATVADAQAQIMTNFGGCTLGTPPAVNCTTPTGASGPTLLQITATTSGASSGALRWNEHHGYLTNDTSTWDDTKTSDGQAGSGVLQFLKHIAPAGGW
jgi:hypothetical protein